MRRGDLEVSMRFALMLLTILVCATITFADDKPASQPADNATAIKPDDKDAIAANLDKDVIIEGSIDKAEWSKTGKVLIATFKDGAETKLQAIIFVKSREKFDKAFSGDVSKALSGAKVRVKGNLKEFKAAPEIVLDTVDQVTTVEASPVEKNEHRR